MQVIDLANDLKVSVEGLVQLLREMGIPVADSTSEVREADVSRILARIERERRAGHKDVSEALEAAIEDAQAAHRPRRRRRRAAPEKEEDQLPEAQEPETRAEESSMADAQASEEAEPTPGESLDEGVADEVEAEGPLGGADDSPSESEAEEVGAGSAGEEGLSPVEEEFPVA
ncbi:MAG: hypothetical protein ACWGSQ_17665, partial [Longimicrobiales bacterium]